MGISGAAIYTSVTGGGGGGGGGGIGTANIWVNTSAGSCTRSASLADYNASTACGSLDAANDICQNNDVVGIKGGDYARQTVTGGNGRSAYCTFYNATGETAVVGSTCSSGPTGDSAQALDFNVASWIKMDGGSGLNIRTGTDHHAAGDNYGNTDFYCTVDTERGSDHIYLNGLHFGNFHTSQTPNFTLSDSELGPIYDTNSKLYYDSGPATLDHNYIHDYGCSNDANPGCDTPHMECLFFDGAGGTTETITVSRNHFHNCPVMSIHAKEGAPFNHTRLENNIFDPGTNTMQFAYACTDMLARNNLFGDGYTFSGCTSPTVTGNIFLSSTSGCEGSGFTYDIWTSGSTSCANSSIQTAASMFTDPDSYNYHLKDGSPAIDAGNPSNYPSLDFAGVSRYLGSGPDAGPYEAG